MAKGSNLARVLQFNFENAFIEANGTDFDFF